MDQEALNYSPNEAQVDLSCLDSNLAAMRARAGNAAVMAVIKANAYGHGSAAIARALGDGGVRHFAVAQLPEAIELRKAGVTNRIVVFGVPLARDIPVYHEYDLDMVVATDETVADLARSQETRELCVHVKVDTGMHRLGVSPPDAAETIRRLKAMPGIRLSGLWTHLASSDEPADPLTDEQLRRFEPIVDAFGDSFDFVHAGASSGLWNFRDRVVAPSAAMIRLGISLYGYLEDDATSLRAGLLPAMRLVSRVAQVRTVPAGEGVSYNPTWIAEEDSVVAVVAAGYADGYSRLLSNRALVGIAGTRYPVVGTICMDMLMVNLGRRGSAPPVKAGDPVVLFGEGGPSAFEVANWGETIVYEVCTSVPSRVRRTYV